MGGNLKLGEVLEEIRRRKGTPDEPLQKQELARMLGVHPSTVGAVGVGTEQQWRMILKVLDICDELGIDPRESAEKAGHDMTAKELEERMVGILERLLLQEKPRPQRELLRIAKKGYDRAEKRRREQQESIVSEIPGETQDHPRKNTSR